MTPDDNTSPASRRPTTSASEPSSQAIAQSMRGRVCLVTGASAGLGRATAMGLARLGANVVLLMRESDHASRAFEDTQAASTGGTVSQVSVDLASLTSIRSAAAEIATRFPVIHVLVNNAGVNVTRRTQSVDGHELTLAVNHLAPFLLTTLLLPCLQAGVPSRIVNVASRLERYGRIDFSNLELTKGYGATRAYNQSKLANVLFTYALARRLQGTGITVNCVHPGLVATRLMRQWPGWMRAIWERFLLSPEKGARGIVWLASSTEADAVTGRYFEGVGRAVQSSRRSNDFELQERLWALSSAMVGES